ncbi:hypothetical protein EPUS_09310 [Endocarpon pusillum Z07020]|uniref:Uncharacterized protein n=1 Tax=Endocarpon pusillum (strain Z07020 / HMAS-L-300199) TaxID=1263415 RepID=U1FXV9_ENDPU|nr:uncharacterized protein EPUS_09310 [Endocarpon pusillum Z07020]ERF69732.1 hypothetical protein EPUS_09310 [Endocarpon pusillum Z07020]
MTIKKLQKSSSSPSTPFKLPPLPITTPQTAHAICRLCKASPSLQKAIILERAVLRLAAKFEIQSHENRGLRAAIVQEKKRRRRGKRLNLLGKEATSEAQFFSPTKVITARAYQESKEAAEAEEKRQKAVRKEEAALKRQQLQAEKQEAVLQRQLRQEARQEAKAAEKVQKAAEREEKRRQKEQDKQQKALAAQKRKKEQELRKNVAVAVKTAAESKSRVRRVSIGPPKPRKTSTKRSKKTVNSITASQGSPPRPIEAAPSTAVDTANVAVAEALIVNRRGRVVALPQRFRE